MALRVLFWDEVGRRHVLVVFDELVEAEQDAQPAADLVRLQVEDDLLHDVGPLVGVVLLDHVVDARCQLDPASVKRVGRLFRTGGGGLGGSFGVVRPVWLPDALRRVDDGLHDVFSDDHPVLLRDGVNELLCSRLVGTAPVLSDHVLQINHSCTDHTRFRLRCNMRLITVKVILNDCHFKLLA